MRRLTRGTALAACLLAARAMTAEPDARAIVEKGTAAGAIACRSCHGAAGEGNPPAGFPRLAGLDAGYLLKQLRDIRAGLRESPVMAPIAKALSDEEAERVALYYGALPVPPAPAAAAGDPAKLAQGERLSSRGDWVRELPACFSCHAPGGTGVGGFPALAGQSAPYMKGQLMAWKAGTRRNDPLELMKVVAARLSDEEIDAVTLYLSTLPPGGEGATR